ncbi:MAG: 30S ribosomal protein S3 [Dehalococcoidia bacterium]|nr:MAG: 30S ribosomal protein S3 [Dehalococcoidia bacterium]
MGRKVHPLGFRIGVTTDWQSRWYADKTYAEFLREDLRLRRAINDKYADAGIAGIEVERQASEVTVTIHTARPGIVIGRGGQRVDETRTQLEKMIGKKIRLNIREIQQPELNAYLVAKAVADQLAHRIAHRRAMKQAMFRTMQAGAKGIRIRCSGRLGGAEIARREVMHEGRVPLQTIRADIDYGFTEARTTMGRIGVKVWLYKGDILPELEEAEAEEALEVAVSEAPEAVTEGAPEKPVAVAETTIEKAEEAVEAPTDEAAEPATKKKATPRAKAAKAPEAEATEETPAKPARRVKSAKAEVEAAEETPAKPVKRARAARAEVETAGEAPAKPTRQTKAVKAQETEAAAEPEKKKRKTTRSAETGSEPEA